MKGLRVFSTDFYGNEFVVEKMMPLSSERSVTDLFMLVSMSRELHTIVTYQLIEKAIRDGERIDKYDNY